MILIISVSVIFDNQTDMCGTQISKKMKATTFLTFVGDQCGRSEEVVNVLHFYISVFPYQNHNKIIRRRSWRNTDLSKTVDGHRVLKSDTTSWFRM